jgi:hypothetical protein
VFESSELLIFIGTIGGLPSKYSIGKLMDVLPW